VTYIDSPTFLKAIRQVVTLSERRRKENEDGENGCLVLIKKRFHNSCQIFLGAKYQNYN
jgi:hypothetical protein